MLNGRNGGRFRYNLQHWEFLCESLHLWECSQWSYRICQQSSSQFYQEHHKNVSEHHRLSKNSEVSIGT